MGKTTLKEFEAVFPLLVDELMGVLEQYKIPAEAAAWYRRNLEQNTLGGKCNRGMSVVDTYSILTGQDKLSDTEYLRTAILGWCTELLQAFFLVADDIMDSSKTRRGSPCWYLFDGVGNIAINDSFMLESAVFILIKKHFRKESYYIDLVELFQETIFQTELGQLLDLITAPEDRVDLSKFSLAKHSFIVIFKTAYYSFYLPVALAMYMAGIATESNLKQARDVLIPLGEYFQIQDDYLDCYGDPEHIGKIGTDIKDNKCGWLINKALAIATPEQRDILDKNYGRKDDEAEARIKQVYIELELEKCYQEYEEQAVGKIRGLIDQVDESNGLKKEVLTSFLNKIYKRSK
ncbi:farnesyl pyrophosphate synthase [Drechslerella stenobrocha 248]|uniref:Farnesyl pyrophosphate synthase n=1 Tax=Drechslerella stenobrocha 248 TaxID=1043628 RepID=W7I4W9_9PEZI|nr:farnesyl pyrophosphate synthase [Drechslerella stenobrocha 248]